MMLHESECTVHIYDDTTYICQNKEQNKALVREYKAPDGEDAVCSIL